MSAAQANAILAQIDQIETQLSALKQQVREIITKNDEKPRHGKLLPRQAATPGYAYHQTW